MKKLLALILALLMCLSLCACGGSAKESAATEMRTESAAYDMAAPMEMAEEEYGGFAMTDNSTSAAGAEAPEENSEKIIYSADLTIETTDFETSVGGLAGLVEQYGGYIQSSSINGADYYSSARGYSALRSASYTLRIPCEHFSPLMNSFSALGNIPYSYTYTENISAQYYDAQARLNVYKAQEERLLEMMEQAESVSDIIIIEEKLTELRYEIESIQSMINNWDRRVSYSTVNVYIEEVREYTPEAEMSYGEELLRSFVQGLKATGRFFSDLLLSLVGALPTLVLLAVLFVILRPVFKKLRLRRRLKKRGGKKSESPEEKDIN